MMKHYGVMWIHHDGWGGLQAVLANSPREAVNGYKTAVNKEYLTFQVMDCETGVVTTFNPTIDELAKGYKPRGRL